MVSEIPFWLFLPAVYDDTLKQSKNLSIFSIKLHVSLASVPPVSLSALATEELNTFKNQHDL